MYCIKRWIITTNDGNFFLFRIFKCLLCMFILQFQKISIPPSLRRSLDWNFQRGELGRGEGSHRIKSLLLGRYGYFLELHVYYLLLYVSLFNSLNSNKVRCEWSAVVVCFICSTMKFTQTIITFNLLSLVGSQDVCEYCSTHGCLFSLPVTWTRDQVMPDSRMVCLKCWSQY